MSCDVFFLAVSVRSVPRTIMSACVSSKIQVSRLFWLWTDW